MSSDELPNVLSDKEATDLVDYVESLIVAYDVSLDDFLACLAPIANLKGKEVEPYQLLMDKENEIQKKGVEDE